MDITFISDTHGLHHACKLVAGSILIHAGDITEYGTEEEVTDFLHWFSKQPFTHKIFIAGNHDLFLEQSTVSQRKKLIPKGITYLRDSYIALEGLKIWGSPVTPYFLGMAFNKRSGEDIKRTWDKIPIDTDILITHGPARGILDNGIGCEALLARVKTVKPTVHCFGHAHGQHGMLENSGITFINSALVNLSDPFTSEEYRIVGKPITLLI